MGMLKEMKNDINAFAKEIWDLGQKMADDHSLFKKIGMSDRAAKVVGTIVAPGSALFLIGMGIIFAEVSWLSATGGLPNLIGAPCFVFAVGGLVAVVGGAVIGGSMLTKSIKNIIALSHEKTPVTVLLGKSTPVKGLNMEATSAAAFKNAVDGQKPSNQMPPFNPTTPNP